MEALVYNTQGKETGKIALPAHIFDVAWNADLVHQVVTSMQANARNPIAHTKTRGEVRGGGKKPWRQKGTGRARHGSTRSPIWVGGGVTHGPRNDKDMTRKVSKKMRTKAMLTILSEKQRQGELIFIDSVSLKEPKTKEAMLIMKNLGGIKGVETIATKRANAALIGIARKDASVSKSFQNIGSVKLESIANWNPVELLRYKYAVIVGPDEALGVIESRIK